MNLSYDLFRGPLLALRRLSKARLARTVDGEAIIATEALLLIYRLADKIMNSYILKRSFIVDNTYK